MSRTPTHFRHPVSKVDFPYTALLAQRGDLIPIVKKKGLEDEVLNVPVKEIKVAGHNSVKKKYLKHIDHGRLYIWSNILAMNPKLIGVNHPDEIIGLNEPAEDKGPLEALDETVTDLSNIEVDIPEVVTDLTPTDPKPIEVKTNIDDMTRRELQAHAKQYYDFTLDPKVKKEEMQAVIRELAKKFEEKAE